MMIDGHCRRRTEMEALGMSRIVIEDGKVVEVGEPKLDYCPLFNKLLKLEKIDRDSVRKNIEYRIESFGLGTENRVLRSGDYVTFGVSEIISTALSEGLLDAAVIAADGCGTAVITEPELLQGLCGRISGMVSTTPIDCVLDAVGRDNVVDPENTPIDQIAGAELADAKGYPKFAVTISRPEDALVLRRKYGNRILLIAVHTSCISDEGARTYYDVCDIITTCASRILREIAYAREDIVIAGNKIPMVGVTEIGKKLILNKLHSIGKEPWDRVTPTDDPRPWL